MMRNPKISSLSSVGDASALIVQSNALKTVLLVRNIFIILAVVAAITALYFGMQSGMHSMDYKISLGSVLGSCGITVALTCTSWYIKKFHQQVLSAQGQGHVSELLDGNIENQVVIEGREPSQEGRNLYAENVFELPDEHVGNQVASSYVIEERVLSQERQDALLYADALQGAVQKIEGYLLFSQKFSQNGWNAAGQIAGEQGHLQVIHLLCNKLNDEGWNYAFCAAVRCNHIHIVKRLLEDKKVIDNILFDSAFRHATKKGYFATIECLLKENIEPSPDMWAERFDSACENNNKEMIKALLCVERRLSPDTLASAICWAVCLQDCDLIKQLLRNGNMLDMKGLNDAIRAITSDNVEIVRLLFAKWDRKCCDVEKWDFTFCYVFRNSYKNVIEFLFNQGLRPSVGVVRDMFIEASGNGHAGVLELLFSNELKPGEEDSKTILSKAFEFEHRGVVELLLRKGFRLSADVASQVFISASEKGKVGALNLLFSKGLQPSEETSKTIMRSALEKGHVDCIGLLLSQGIKLSQDDLKDAFEEAVQNKNTSMIRALLSGDKTPEAWGTVFCDAVRRGHVHMTEALLSGRRKPNQQEVDEAVCEAALMRHVDMIEFLCRIGQGLCSETWDKTVYCVVMNGSPDLLGRLLNREEELSQGGWEAATAGAVWCGDESSLALLLEYRNRVFSPARLLRVVLDVVAQRRIGILTLLLRRQGPLNQIALETVVSRAIELLNEETVRFLLSEGRVLESEALSRQVIYAASTGSFSIIEFLLGQWRGAINVAVFTVAINQAAGAERTRIIQILRSRMPSVEAPLPRVAVQPQPLINQYIVKWSDLAAHPDQHLVRVVERDTLPERVVIHDDRGRQSSAIDLGGVSKQYISVLCEALLTQRCLFVTETGLLLAHSEADKDMYVKFGRLISHIYASNEHKTDKMVTGYVFSKRFLEIVKAIATAVDPEAGFKDVCSILKADPSLCSTVNVILDPSLANKKAYYESMGEEEAAEAVTHEDVNVIEEARGGIQLYYDTAQWFFEGIRGSLFHTKLSTGTHLAALCDSFQGVPISVEGVMRSLRCRGRHAFLLDSQQIIDKFSLKNANEIQTLQTRFAQKFTDIRELDAKKSAFQDKVQWLIEILATKDISKEEDKQWLRAFVMMITGKTALSLNQQIIIEPDERMEHPTFEMHTCFSSITLPNGEISLGNFIEALNAIVGGGSSYNIR